MMSLRGIFGYCIIFILLAGTAAAADRISIIDADGNPANLKFGTGVSNSYLDNVGENPDIKLRVYTSDMDEELDGRYVCLLYKTGNSFKIINFGTTDPETPCEQLGEEIVDGGSKYAETRLENFGLDSTKAFYPAILFGAVSEDKQITLLDEFIQLNPTTDGWLVGGDGGYPCNGGGGLWIACGAEQDADPYFDSYDVFLEDRSGSLRVWVNATYYPVNTNTVQQSTIDADMITVGIKDENGNFLDSGITSLYDMSNGPDTDDSDDYLDLDYGMYTGVLSIYVNSIKTAEYNVGSVSVPTTPSTDTGDSGDGGESGGSGASGGGSSGVPVVITKEVMVNRTGVLVFPIKNSESVEEIIVYLTNPVLSGDLELKGYDYGELDKPVYAAHEIRTDISNSDVYAVFMQFKVDEQWMLDNGIYKNDIMVSYMEDGEWKSIPARLRKDLDNGFEYVVRMDKLRSFVIGGKYGLLMSLSDNEMKELEEQYALGEESNVYWWWLLIILIILMFLAYIFERNQKKERESELKRREGREEQ